MRYSDKMTIIATYLPKCAGTGNDSKLRHIMRLRAATGAGLKECKDTVEAGMANDTGLPVREPILMRMTAEQYGRLLCLNVLDESADVVGIRTVETRPVSCFDFTRK